MEPNRFDTVARLLAGRRLSRRQALIQGSASIAAIGGAAGLVRGADAQDATPTAVEPVNKPGVPTFMFVQSFKSGSFAPKAESSDEFTLTLEQGLGQTIYFSDRPERIFGAGSTSKFLDTFPFGPVNPPNAALVLETGADDTDVVVLELTAPQYDEATHTATYDAKILTNYEKLGATLQEEPKTEENLPAQFSAASLFIDDCPDGAVECCLGAGYLDDVGGCSYYAVEEHLQPIGMCWSWAQFECLSCETLDSYTGYCNDGHLANCTGDCVGTPADWKIDD